MKTAEQIKIGDYVRSYDFADGEHGRDLTGERATYVEGRVEEIGAEPLGLGFDTYTIKIERAISGGVEYKSSCSHCYPPVNGTPKLTGGVTDGVEKLV